jgi:hypothetical protein
MTISKSALVLLLGLLPLTIYCQAEDWTTYYERSNCLKTPRYEETVNYLTRLDAFSPQVTCTTFGRSPQGRDLLLVIADKNGNHTPEAVRASGNAICLIQACIHPGESEGKDAGMMLLRDLVSGKELSWLLDHVTVLFMPIFNVDGHERFGPYNRINQNGPEEMGWRVTAQNINLNRDYIKADAPEMRAWLKVFRQWMPDLLVDCHTTDGADYQYVLTYSMEVFGSMDTTLTRWQNDVFLPYINDRMQAKGRLIFPYVSFRTWHDPRSGLYRSVTPPMFSQGYVALLNRPSLLIETHMLKPYKDRVESTYDMLVTTLELLNTEYTGLARLIARADEYTASPRFREKELPVKFQNFFVDSSLVNFKGVEYREVKSDITGGSYFKYDGPPADFQVYLFDQPRATETVMLPEAYLVPVEWQEVINRLDYHGIAYRVLETPARLKVKTYTFKEYRWSNKPFEGHHTLAGIQADPIETEAEYPAGSAVVDMNQQTARIIAHLLEPKAASSLLYWGFFNIIFEQKEYSESYVMEEMAKKMLLEQPELKAEFDRKMAGDKDFAANPRDILNWFYAHSPYWDQKKDVYPVGMVFDRAVVEGLRKISK